MELFDVKRYTGEDTSPNIVPDVSALKKILIEKVKRRKKLRLKENCGSNVVNVGNYSKMPSKIKNYSFGSFSCANTKEQPFIEAISEEERKEVKELDSESENDLGRSKKRKSRNCKLHDRKLTNGCREANDAKPTESMQETKPFSVLGVDVFTKPAKVKRSIPQWLANPSVVSIDLKNLDTPVDYMCGLDEIFIQTLKDNKITHFFPVQKQIIPWLLENMKKPSFYWPRDVCVSAPTGSGKTLAFVLPILQALHRRIIPQLQAIVVLPVHDLAVQIFKVFEIYSKPTKLNILLLSKKRPFLEEQKLIRRKDELLGYTTLVDIVITTAGRLVDHLLNTDGFSLDHLKFLVIDEADRVMDDMQNDWLYHLNKKLLAETSKSYQTPLLTFNTLFAKRKLPQKLLFSATLSQDPEKLQQLGLFQPKLFTSIVSGNTNEENVARFIGKYTTPAELQEYYTLSTKALKPLIVHHLLLTQLWRNVLCFVNSVQVGKRLSFLLRTLNKGLNVKSISAKLTPRDRNKLIGDFEKGLIKVLISSDALARGMDLPNVKYVISYNCPKYLKTYIHRIGRTARAGKTGASLVLLTENEFKQFDHLIQSAGKKAVSEMKMKNDILEQYTKEYESALKKLQRKLKNQKTLRISTIRSKKNKNKCLRK